MSRPSSNEARRAEAIRLYGLAVAAADPARGVERALGEPSGTLASARRVTMVAVGKAALSMAEAARPHVGGRLAQALVVTTPQAARPLDWARVIAGGHPVPDEGSAQAGAAVRAAVSDLGPDDALLLLISGGGSALLVAPPDGVSLADKVALSSLLLTSGASIDEMNAVRSAVSRLKGGGLVRLARPAAVEALLLSDVPGDDVAVIASGLSAPTPADPARALEVLAAYGLLDAVAPAILAHLRGPGDDAGSPPDVRNRVIGSNAQSVDAMAAGAHAAGWPVIRIPGWLDGDVAVVAERLVRVMRDATRPVAVLAGGETTVTVRGRGLGGRNQELALRVALFAERGGLARPWTFLSAGTDGRDGPTEAAGAVVDAGTLGRMRAAGIDPDERLAVNDSYPALLAAGDLLPATATGTNVADTQIGLVG